MHPSGAYLMGDGLGESFAVQVEHQPGSQRESHEHQG